MTPAAEVKKAVMNHRGTENTEKESNGTRMTRIAARITADHRGSEMHSCPIRADPRGFIRVIRVPPFHRSSVFSVLSVTLWLILLPAARVPEPLAQIGQRRGAVWVLRGVVEGQGVAAVGRAQG